jgi:hypothetical protein
LSFLSRLSFLCCCNISANFFISFYLLILFV